MRESASWESPEQLLPAVYDELRRMAAARMAAERPGHTLDATALVHEVYLRLCKSSQPPATWNDRTLFFAAAGEAMRRILVDQARQRSAEKRGGAARREELHESQIAAPQPSVDLLALDEALTDLEVTDEAAARLVKLRFCVGLTMTQAAEALGVSERSAYDLWAYARSWLRRRLNKP